MAAFKKEIIVQRGWEGGEGSLLLFSFPFARNKENGNIESRIWIGCSPFTIIPVNTLLAARRRLL